jgi:glycosyltransferase involved in cell wall biosynthesis
MEKRVRILRLIARLNIGGPAIQAITLSSALNDSRNKYETLLVCGSLSPGEGDMAYLALEKKVQPTIIKELGRNISLFDDIKSFFAIRRLIKRFKPDILHTHTAKAGTLGRLAVISMRTPFNKLKKIRMVHTFHGHTFHSYFGRLKTAVFILVERSLARFTDRVIVVSNQQKIDICDTYKIANQGRVQVIRLGLDLTNFQKIKFKHKTIDINSGYTDTIKPFRVGVIGRLTAIKNPFMLLEAIKYLSASGKLDKFKFYFVGDGELKAGLADKTGNLNLKDVIIFDGWQEDMLSVYSQLDAVGLTSKNEGTPVAVIESMASSRPVIATDVGGVPDLLGKVLEKRAEGFQIAERGLMVPSEDAGAFAAGLLFLLENMGGLAPMVRRAKEFVLANYAQERLLNDIRQLYEQLR